MRWTMVKTRKRRRKINKIKRFVLRFIYKTFFKHDDIVLKIIFIALIAILIFSVNALQEQGVFCCVLLAYF